VVGHPGFAGLERLTPLRRVARPECACHHAARVPTYDYQCRRCGHITEVIHSMLEEGPSACERCGGELRRVFHPTGIIFKGGGFYKTDSRSADSTSGARSSSPAKSSSPGGDSKGSAGSGDGAGGGSEGSTGPAGKPAEPAAS
jgi:putative FmdB family regulatory protein